VVSIYLSLFISSSFCSPNLSGRRLDVYHTSTHGVILAQIQNAGLKRAARRTRLAENAARTKSPKIRQLGTIAQIVSGSVPNGFNHSYIVPIKKVKDTRTKALTCNDFRSIAISPIISKVFEYCVFDRYKDFFGSADNQFGFRKGLSCSYAVYSTRCIVDSIIKNGNTAIQLIYPQHLIKSIIMVFYEAYETKNSH